ncbi:MAG TPA: thioredoxin family protein [Phycisphaerae bacterium]|nr:thioredoxin family protein [Phycisphaerae bacterium]HRW52631.1 thioredoxin family protein [Phycisphaerae bacterium]
MTIRLIQAFTVSEFESLVADAAIAVVHFDADWDAILRTPTRIEMRKAEEALGDHVVFAEVDVDASVDVARSIPIANVPAVAYYRHGELMDVVIGAGQDVSGLTRRVIAGEPIGRQAKGPSVLRRTVDMFVTSTKSHWRKELLRWRRLLNQCRS